MFFIALLHPDDKNGQHEAHLRSPWRSKTKNLSALVIAANQREGSRTFCTHPGSERPIHLWNITQELEQERGPT